jgi:hypothetical protein
MGKHTHELTKLYRSRSKKIHHWTQEELHAVSSIWKKNFIRMDRYGICKRIRNWFNANRTTTTTTHIPTTNAILAKIAICASAVRQHKM